MKNLNKNHYYMLFVWFAINMLQSIFTGLHSDEAYYWMYSKNLDWGFFDHPPMIAFLVKIGYALIHAELGVRLLILLLSTLTMAMILNELNEREDFVFLSVFVLSFPLVHTHIGGFMAIPDTPLVFFSLLFYLLYKKFVTGPTLKLSLVMGVVAAAMVYSKYHAFLVFGFIVLSNLKLLRNKYFWLTIVIAGLLLIPHFYWQFANDFPSFKYHLIGRSKPVRFWTVQNNLTSQLLVAGPLTSLIIFWGLTKFRIGGDDFKRAVVVSILGFYIFFFFMSFKNRIEAHYTTVITPLLMIATYDVISGNPIAKKWFKRLAIPTVAAFFLFRFYLAADFLPNFGEAKISFYKHKKTMQQIKQMADGKQVAAFNNFAFPGTYEFYTGDKAILLSTPGYRYCQFDLWSEEASAVGDTVFAVIPSRMDTTNLVLLNNGRKIKPLLIAGFQWLEHVDISPVGGTLFNDSLKLRVKIINNSENIIKLNHSTAPAIGFMVNRLVVADTALFALTGKDVLGINEQIVLDYSVPVPVNKEDPLVVFLQTKDLNRGKMFKVNFEDYK